MLNYATLRTVGGADYKVLEDNSESGGFSTITVKTPDGWKVAVISARGVCDTPEFSLVARRDIIERYYNVYRAAGGGFVFGKRAFASDRDRRAARDSQRAIFGMKVAVDVTNGRFISSQQV